MKFSENLSEKMSSSLVPNYLRTQKEEKVNSIKLARHYLCKNSMMGSKGGDKYQKIFFFLTFLEIRFFDTFLSVSNKFRRCTNV